MKFVNPYNFIPFGTQAPSVKKEREGEKLLTGCIEYSLLTKTPLIIPNTSNEDIFGYAETVADHKSYEFFSYEDLSAATKSKEGKKPANPVIPGSEIRGMFRSNYEILTDSCLPFVDTDQILHKRVSGFFKPGLIKKTQNRYELYEAEDCLLRTAGPNNLDTQDQFYEKKKCDIQKYGRCSYIQDKFQEGQKVYVCLKSRDGKCKKLVLKMAADRNDAAFRSEKKVEEGYLLKGMPGPNMLESQDKQKAPKSPELNKHCAHVFLVKSERISANLDITRLDNALKVYAENAGESYANPKATYREYIQQWKRFKEGKGNEYFPVYYSRPIGKVKDLIYLSPASGTLETYEQTLAEILGGKKACTSKSSLCPACALFGMLNGKDAVASRIRFTDLKCEKHSFDKITVLQELSSPKLQNMEFYLQRPSEKAQFWTYEYWVDLKGEVHTYDEKTPLKLNGRKFYWHSERLADEAKERNNRNVTVRPLAAGSVFKGKVYFEKLTAEEVKRLVWLVNCGDIGGLQNKEHGYKLGHAKPLGYGSVAISVDAVKIRELVKKDENIAVEYRDQTVQYIASDNETSLDPKVLENFRIMTDFHYVKKKAPGALVMYPKVEGEEEVFKWFVQNHGKHSQERRKANGQITQESYYENEKRQVMPGSRQEMIFKEYMKAMVPMLNAVVPQYVQSNRNEKNTPKFKEGAIVEGTVTKIFEDNSTSGFAKQSDGNSLLVVGLPDGMKVGNKITMRLGTNKKGKPYGKYVK